MKYEYFVSFVAAKKTGYDFGNINITFPCNIANITEIKWAELRIKEKIKVNQVIILNYQLLRKWEVQE